MKFCMVVLILMGGLVGGGLVAIRSGGAEEGVSQSVATPFAGKCLVITTKDFKTGAYLENAEVRTLAGRDFLVGKVIGATDRWIPLAGKMEWLSLDSINQIYEFNSVSEIKDANAVMMLQRKADAPAGEQSSSGAQSSSSSN